MQIRCKAVGRGSRLIQSLQMRGYMPREHDDSVVFSLIKKRGNFYEIPLSKNYQLFLETTEKTINSKAIVVCTVGGNPIYPHRKNHFCDNTSYFRGKKLCTVAAHSNGSMVTVSCHGIEIKNNQAKIASKIIWSGRYNLEEGIIALPFEAKKFEQAARAAKQKSRCRMCNCTHYAL